MSGRPSTWAAVAAIAVLLGLAGWSLWPEREFAASDALAEMQSMVAAANPETASVLLRLEGCRFHIDLIGETGGTTTRSRIATDLVIHDTERARIVPQPDGRALLVVARGTLGNPLVRRVRRVLTLVPPGTVLVPDALAGQTGAPRAAKAALAGVGVNDVRRLLSEPQVSLIFRYGGEDAQRFLDFAEAVADLPEVSAEITHIHRGTASTPGTLVAAQVVTPAKIVLRLGSEEEAIRFGGLLHAVRGRCGASR